MINLGHIVTTMLFSLSRRSLNTCSLLRRYATNQHELGKLTSLAFTHQAMGRYEKAIENYNKILEIEPENVITHINVATAYLTIGQQDALKHFQQAINIIEKTDNEQGVNLIQLYFQHARALKQMRVAGDVEYATKALTEIKNRKSKLETRKEKLIAEGQEEKEREAMNKTFEFEDGTDADLDYVVPPLTQIRQELEELDHFQTAIEQQFSIK
jgi:tetratricopeptide (TPR) repeat protein